MTLRIRRILVAVRDPRHTPRSLLRKAATLAQASHARVELFHAIDDPLLAETARYGRRSRSAADDLETVRTRAVQRLERLARSAFPDPRRVQVHAEWDYPPHEAIVRRAVATRADLVIAATRERWPGARLLLANTDWELIRTCPCPLLLVKTPRACGRGAVIACLDPFHAHDKPAALDRRILDAGTQLANAIGGELHAFHAYLPIVATVPSALGQPVPVWLPPDVEEQHGRRVRAAFDALAREARIPPARRHLRMGDIANELTALIRRTRARVVVMGAVSRSGLKRLFIGNTAERVLDRLPCDVLIVKPRGFRSPVPPR